MSGLDAYGDAIPPGHGEPHAVGARPGDYCDKCDRPVEHPPADLCDECQRAEGRES